MSHDIRTPLTAIIGMTKIEIGKMTLNNNTVSLPELQGDVIAIIHPDIKAKKQSFAVHPYSLRFENICSDALWLRQVFLNILSNAPIFIASAYDRDDAEKEALDLGISGFLTKPFFVRLFTMDRKNLCSTKNAAF